MLRRLLLVAPSIAVLGACSRPSPSASASASASPSASPVASAIAAGETHAKPSASADASAAAPPDMIALPAAVYLVGARAGTGNADERPMHEAVLAAFALDRTEVTVKAYRACVEAGACKPPRDTHPFCNTRFSDRDDHPVNCVD